jgi:ATP-dependent Clp protease ATP-binding subunit ClpA
MMMGGLWTRLFIVVMLIGVVAASRPLAFFMVGVAWVVLIGLVLYKGVYLGRYLPQFVLDRLDRRERERREAARKEAKLTAIDADELAAKLRAKVVGQDYVIDQVARTLRRRFLARRPNKPLAVFCFAGPPGVGKTHLAKVLAETLYGDARHLHFIDMSTAGQGHAAQTLFGSPKGYMGSDSYGQVTTALRDTPNAVMLLDEFEKADGEVHKRFLTAWNDGFVTEVSDGTKFSTAETIFVLTTNAASRRIGELAREHTGSPEDLDRVVKSSLADAQFAPEVLSRIDEVFAFREMRGLDIARVVVLEIEGITKQYDLEIANAGIDPQILVDAIDKVEEPGAKGGVREISRNLERQIADGLVDAKLAGASRVRFVPEGEKIRVIPEPDAPKPAGSPASVVTPA